jgi:hypothetical protein
LGFGLQGTQVADWPIWSGKGGLWHRLSVGRCRSPASEEGFFLDPVTQWVIRFKGIAKDLPFPCLRPQIFFAVQGRGEGDSPFNPQSVDDRPDKSGTLAFCAGTASCAAAEHRPFVEAQGQAVEFRRPPKRPPVIKTESETWGRERHGTLDRRAGLNTLELVWDHVVARHGEQGLT